MKNAREEALRVIEQLPEDSSWEEVLYHLGKRTVPVSALKDAFERDEYRHAPPAEGEVRESLLDYSADAVDVADLIVRVPLRRYPNLQAVPLPPPLALDIDVVDLLMEERQPQR